MINKFIPERARLFSENGTWSMISGGQHHAVALSSEGTLHIQFCDEHTLFALYVKYFVE